MTRADIATRSRNRRTPPGRRSRRGWERGGLVTVAVLTCGWLAVACADPASDAPRLRADASNDTAEDTAVDATPDVPQQQDVGRDLPEDSPVEDADAGEADADVSADADAELDAADTEPDVPLGPPCTADPDCEDGVGCTQDRCEDGFCQTIFTHSLCDDGVMCTADECTRDGCVSPPSDALCDDNEPCTDDICSITTGCSHENRPPGLCDDGVFCNGPDMCVAGVCTNTGEPACEEGDMCDEAGGRCVECMDDSQCPEDMGVSDACDGFDSLCDETGMGPGTFMDWSCVDGACVAEQSEGIVPCTRDQSGVSCGSGMHCYDGSCASDVLVTVENSGNATSAARFRVTCLATGALCRAQGNRDTHLGPVSCSIICPPGTDVELCCSNGDDPCGGVPQLPNDGRSIDDYEHSGFASHSCTTTTDDLYLCTATLAGTNAMVDCGWTD